MKNKLIILILLFPIFSFSKSIRSYFRKSGKFVMSYQRTRANKTKLDNYSSKGNINPYTGKKGTK